MIIIRLWGGIGNQLFQYSFGEYLRGKIGTVVKYDITSFGSSDKKRCFELGVLDDNLPIVDNVMLSKHTGILNRIYRFLFSMNKNNEFILESDFKNIKFTESKCYYLQGYWQKELYVNEISSDIFVSKQELPEDLWEIRDRIRESENPVCVHIRRGDYFLSDNVKRYGICDIAYFHRAINYVHDKCNDCTLFIFSDDLDWVRNNLFISDRVFWVPNYSVNSYWYIYLMTLCKHNIISNSSFSWWGAYLNQSVGKIVISPAKWKNNVDETLSLSSWIKL